MRKYLIIVSVLLIGCMKIYSQSPFTTHILVFRDSQTGKKLHVELHEGEYREDIVRKSMYYKASIPKSLKKYEHLGSTSFEYLFSEGFRSTSSYSGGMIKCSKDTNKQNYTLFGLHTVLRYSPACDMISPIFVLGKPTAWKTYGSGSSKDNIYRSEKYFLAENNSYPAYTYQFFSGRNTEYNFVSYDFCPKIGIVKATFRNIIRIKDKEIVKRKKERQRTYILHSIDGLSVEEFCRQGKCITICCDLKEVE